VPRGIQPLSLSVGADVSAVGRGEVEAKLTKMIQEITHSNNLLTDAIFELLVKREFRAARK
jgi:hypothetical protein